MTDDLPSLQNSPEPRTSFKKHTWGLAVGSSFAIITDLSITLNRNCTWYPISHPLCSKKKNPKNQFSSKWFGTIYGYSSEKAMALHSSTLAWKIPWTEEPGGLQSMGSLRVGHDWATSLSLFTFLHWRRKWQPTPVFLPGESQGRGNLVGCHLWGHTESDTTEAT